MVLWHAGINLKFRWFSDSATFEKLGTNQWYHPESAEQPSGRCELGTPVTLAGSAWILSALTT